MLGGSYIAVVDIYFWSIFFLQFHTFKKLSKSTRRVLTVGMVTLTFQVPFQCFYLYTRKKKLLRQHGSRFLPRSLALAGPRIHRLPSCLLGQILSAFTTRPDQVRYDPTRTSVKLSAWLDNMVDHRLNSVAAGRTTSLYILAVSDHIWIYRLFYGAIPSGIVSLHVYS